MRRVLRVAAACGLLACGCATTDPALRPQPSAEPARPAAPRPDDDPYWALLELAPAEAEAVVLFDYERLRRRRWVTALLTQTGGDGVRGLSPPHEAERGVLVVLPSNGAELVGDNVEILHGRFDVERVLAAFNARHGEAGESRFRDRRLFESRTGAALALAGGKTLVFGSREAVRRVLDVGAGLGRGLAGETWLADARKVLRRGAADRTTRGEAELFVRGTPEVRERLQRELGFGGAMSWAALRLDSGDDLELAFVARTQGAHEALRLHDELKTAVEAARTRPLAGVLGLDEVLAEVDSGQKDTLVAAALRVSQSRADEIASRLDGLKAALEQVEKKEQATRDHTGAEGRR